MEIEAIELWFWGSGNWRLGNGFETKCGGEAEVSADVGCRWRIEDGVGCGGGVGTVC